MFFTQLSIFTLPIDALKLKGVKQYRMKINESDKMMFINDIYS